MAPARSPDTDPYLTLTDDAAVDAAIAARGERSDRLRRAVELATWTGTLRDLAERGTPLTVRTAGDRTHRGSVVAVGIDHLALRLVNATVVLIAADLVRSVRIEPGQNAAVATGDRDRSQDRTLVEALDALIETGQDIAIALRDTTDLLTGRVVGLGEDVVTMRFAHGETGTAYLPVEAVAEIIVGR